MLTGWCEAQELNKMINEIVNLAVAYYIVAATGKTSDKSYKNRIDIISTLAADGSV